MHLGIFAFGVREYLSAKLTLGTSLVVQGTGVCLPMLENTGLILGQETRVLHAMGQPSPPITTREKSMPCNWRSLHTAVKRALAPHLRPSTAKKQKQKTHELNWQSCSKVQWKVTLNCMYQEWSCLWEALTTPSWEEEGGPQADEGQYDWGSEPPSEWSASQLPKTQSKSSYSRNDAIKGQRVNYLGSAG